MAKITSYGTTPHSVVHPDGSYLNKPINTAYDNAEFSLATGQSDYDVGTNQSSAFNNITTARYASIRTDQTITIKLNSTSDDAITITSSDSPLVIETLEVTAIYITNASGSTANIKIYLT